jgi:hypothetical protein
VSVRQEPVIEEWGMEGGNPKDCRFACGKLVLTNQRFGKTTGMGNGE